MDSLIQGLIGFFEIVVLGIFAVCIIGYALVTFHPVAFYLANYAATLRKIFVKSRSFIMGSPDSNTGAGEGPSKLSIVSIISGLFIIGLFYFTGVISNNASYSFLLPNNERIIDAVYRDVDTIRKDTTLTNRVDSFMFQTLPLDLNDGSFKADSAWQHVRLNITAHIPFFVPPKAERTYYGSFLATQGKIRAKSKESHEELLKFLRLQRGAVLFLFCIAMISLVKLFFIFWGLLLSSWNWYYLSFIDGEAYFTKHCDPSSPHNDKPSKERYGKWRQVFFSNFLIFLLSSLFYVLAMRWFIKVAIFYHVNVIGSYISL